MTIFRLSHEDFEIELYNPMEESKYRLSLYGAGANQKVSANARRVYDAFKLALTKPGGDEC